LGGACGMGSENQVRCFDVIEFENFWIPVSSQAQIHMTHRFLAIIVGILVTMTFLSILSGLSKIKNSKDASILNRLATGAFIIVLFQIYLGMKTVSSAIDPMVTTLHLTGASLLLIIMVKINLHIRRLELNLFTKISPSFIDDLIDLTKPRLSALVIATATLGQLMAPGEITFFKGLISILATSLLVAGACTINCYVERDIDKLMRRTKNRPLPDGRLNNSISLYLGVFLIAITLPTLYFIANPLTMILGLIATVFYIFIYTPMKLKSTWALFMGAIPGAMPPLMGWTTVTNNLDQMGLILFGLLFIWQLPHFLAISIFHKEDYDNAGIQIVPTSEGVGPTKLRIYLYTLMLFAVVFTPLTINTLSKDYFWPAAILSGSFFILTAMGLLYKTDALNRRWAKNYFWGTLIYLPSIMLIMLFFK
jgi:protoheme IX farnesyltransferase